MRTFMTTEDNNVTVEVKRAEKHRVVAERDIVKYLDDKGFKHSLKGFNYTIEAIAGILTGEYNKGLCGLYESVAEKFETTGSRVERAIRHSIQVSEAAKTEKTNNGEFIHSAANYFRYN